ncbi:MAG: bifunctional (p)ppGpp synthetase/guanosine-3',5'-bis(diphosphate) 3'-pyrophosphohydrolase [Patescibacteria group bacterium]|nr:bifunctional (p)ppGpp synthetase/guanosine-3',5'-bis(diphosphate) 3'-pyrophosphohydrolase [Patescibacteria group bacterium]
MASAKDILDLMDSPTEEDRTLIERAYQFAEKAHEGHRRLSGDPYFTHPVETAKGLARLGMGRVVIAAGLLHDTVEDVGVSADTIEKEFGKEIRFLVEGVTKLGRLKYRGSERHVESLRKLLVATSKDARVLIIKLMDRLHNMKTLSSVPEEKRTRIALETLEIYAAIAHRLGMGALRRELEDLAFEYAYPKEFAEAKKLHLQRTKETRTRLEEMSRKLKRALAEGGIVHFESDYRMKGLWSFWRKLERKGGDIEKIYDIEALRVIVDTVSDCYRALGIVHGLWQPLPNKIKDYIAFPKPNGYQSLHTTVFSGDGGIVEIQIRTRQMHEEAERGIASHVFYKENEAGQPEKGGRQTSFDWIKSLLPGFSRRKLRASADGVPGNTPRHYGGAGTPEWLSELGEEGSDPDFETSLRSDIFSQRVFIFSPKGDVVDLPAGASPIDFAYAIHSDIGDHIWGAKVNGKLVPLDTKLHNGDIVYIETRKGARPSTKWLDFAKTTLARRHIRIKLDHEKGTK